MSKITDMRNIRTPLTWKERLNDTINDQKPTKISVVRKLPVALIAVIALAVLLTGTALAYALTGGAFFAKLFDQKASTNPADYSSIDLSQLPEIAGKASGVVVDTDELRIDVIDVISSGNDAMIAMRVTAKLLDSVLLYTGWDEVPLNNYKFQVDNFSLNDIARTITTKYIYSDEDSTLADNQFYFVLNVRALEGFGDSPLRFNLLSFGYYDRLSAEGSSGGFTEVYTGPWTIDIDLSGDISHSRTVFLNQNVNIGNYRYIIKDIDLTPFSCYIVIAYDGAPDPSFDRFKEVMDAAKDLKLYLKNGTALVYDYSATMGGHQEPDSTYLITLTFTVPVDVEDISTLHVFGNDYDISSEFTDVSEDIAADATAP